MTETKIPTNLIEFSERFHTEAACVDFLIDIRWPKGFSCPKCGTGHGHRLKTRDLIECSNKLCCNQMSVTSGTVMHRSKQDLRTWFWGAYLVSTLTPGVSAVQFQRQLRILRYETAYNMLHKLRSALVAPGRELLLDEVEVMRHTLAVRRRIILAGELRKKSLWSALLNWFDGLTKRLKKNEFVLVVFVFDLFQMLPQTHSFHS